MIKIISLTEILILDWPYCCSVSFVNISRWAASAENICRYPLILKISKFSHLESFR